MATTKEKKIIVPSGLGDAIPELVAKGTTFTSESGISLEGKALVCEVDQELDKESTNPVANKVVAEVVEDLENKIKAANSILSIAKTSTSGLVDTYTISFTDGTTTTFTVTNGKDGADGLQGIQGVPGEDGHTPVITIQNGYWYIDGVNTNVLAEGVKGDTGNGISSIEKTSSAGLVDTYTITFTNGTTKTFTVTNGADGKNGSDGADGKDGANGSDGVGISTIVINESGSLVITLTSGTVLDLGNVVGADGAKGEQGEQGIQGEQGEAGEDGNGIASIVKTSTSGLVDTYTITFTNGTKTTFNVTNGADGQDGQDGEDGQDGKDGAGITTKTVTLSASGWNGNTQTVLVEGVTADNTVQVAPSGAMDEYIEAGVYCSAQGAGTLTFTCETVPTVDIGVNVLIFEEQSGGASTGGGSALWSWEFSFSGWTIDETNPNKLIADTAGQAKIDELRNFIAENYQNVKDIRFIMSLAMGDGHNEYNVAFNYLRGDNMGVGANFQAITVTSPSSRVYDCFLLWLDTYSLEISADNFAPVIKGYASGSIKIY